MRAGTGLPASTVGELLLILALNGEIDRDVSAAGFIWRMPVALPAVEDLTTAAGGPMFDDSTREYLRRARTALTAQPARQAVTPWLTARCPECGDIIQGSGLVAAEGGEHAHVVLAGAVVLGCEGYFVINPAALGLAPGQWQDWREDAPDMTVKGRDGTVLAYNFATVAAPLDHSRCDPKMHDRSLPDDEQGRAEVTTAEDGLMGCADCRKPLFWCKNDDQWWHSDPPAACFLTPAWGRPANQPARHDTMTVDTGRDPDWLAEARITTPEQRAYWGEQCSECPARGEYAFDLLMCREHSLDGVCFTCGKPLTCFGRAPGGYVCEGLEQADPESAWRHEHGPYARYEEQPGR